MKKSAYVGLGLAVMSTSAVKSMGKKIADESNLSEEEGKKLVEDLMAESDKSKAQLRKKVEDTVHESVKDMDLATKSDIISVNQRLDLIEKELKNI